MKDIPIVVWVVTLILLTLTVILFSIGWKSRVKKAPSPKAKPWFQDDWWLTTLIVLTWVSIGAALVYYIGFQKEVQDLLKSFWEQCVAHPPFGIGILLGIISVLFALYKIVLGDVDVFYKKLTAIISLTLLAISLWPMRENVWRFLVSHSEWMWLLGGVIGLIILFNSKDSLKKILWIVCVGVLLFIGYQVYEKGWFKPTPKPSPEEKTWTTPYLPKGPVGGQVMDVQVNNQSPVAIGWIPGFSFLQLSIPPGMRLRIWCQEEAPTTEEGSRIYTSASSGTWGFQNPFPEMAAGSIMWVIVDQGEDYKEQRLAVLFWK